MSLTYVIPDVHGRFDLLSEALHRVHAHAAGNGGTLVMLGDAQPETTLLWKRYPKGDAAGFEGRHIVHGHNAFAGGPELYEGRTNLDTQAWRTGRLVTGVFDDAAPAGPVDFIVVQGTPQSR
jgi:serine/threonine protein phosphatase 1